jgi:hypothetical protein
MPTLPVAWTPPYQSVAVTAEQYAVAADRVERFASLNSDVITEAGPYYGRRYLSPGASYTAYFYPAEIGMLCLASRPEHMTQFTNRSDYRAMFEWTLSKQIRNTTTTFTRIVSGGTGTYPLGALPCRIPKSGAINYATPAADQCMISYGDNPDLAHHILCVIALCRFGNLCNWDAEWVTWWQAHRAQVVDAFNVTPYNTSTHLVREWPDGYLGTAFDSVESLVMSGDLVAASTWYYVACLLMAECCYRAGEDQTAIDVYADRATEIKAAIQGKFRAASPTFDGVHLNWDRYQPQTVTNGALEGFAWNSGAGKIHVVTDPTDAENQLLKIEDDSASARIGMSRTFTRTQFRQAWQRARTAFVASQANAALWLWDLLDHTGTRILGLGLGADGKIKATSNGTTWADLPTPTTYAANVKVAVELRFDWTWQQTEVLIGGVSKGIVAMGGAGFNVATIAYQGGISTSDVGSVLHDDMIFYDVPGGGTDTGAMGYLPWETGPDGNTLAVEPTAFAGWAGILTEAQTLQAGRLMSLYYDKPDKSGVGDGDLFLLRAGHRYIKRSPGPWSEDFSPDGKTWPRSYVAWTYGQFMDGGYPFSYSHWPLWLMAQHSPSRAAAAMGALLDDVGLDSHAPYERVDNGMAQGPNYLQAAVSFLGMVSAPLVQWSEPATGFISVEGLLGSETWETLGPPAPSAPLAPQTLLATPGDAQVTLVWSASAGATSYTLYRQGADPATGVTSPYLDAGLTNGTAYKYQVSASNDGGESPRSRAVWATPGGAVTARILDLIV